MYESNLMDFLALGIGFVFLYIIFLVGIFTLFALYYKTIIDTISLVRPSNRETSAGNIMLTFIPLFNIVYGFIVYPKICDSIKREYSVLGLQQEGDFGKGLAITLRVLYITNFIPLLNFLTSIAYLILWIVFWVKIHEYKVELEKHNGKGIGENQSTVSASTDILD